MLATLVLL